MLKQATVFAEMYMVIKCIDTQQSTVIDTPERINSKIYYDNWQKGVLNLGNLCIPMQCSTVHTFMEASMSTVPTRRSSVTPRGICTKGASMTFFGIAPFEEPLICSLRPTCVKDMRCLVSFHRHASHQDVNTKNNIHKQSQSEP